MDNDLVAYWSKLKNDLSKTKWEGDEIKQIKEKEPDNHK